MGKTKGRYVEEYPRGSLVKIQSRTFLEHFLETWEYHNPLDARQLRYANKIGKVQSVGFYHGGDELYQLEGIPGIWHEQCLQSAE